MKVSVAIPCYNGAAFIGRTIESVVAQTRPADEILVVDDGSTDASADIIRRYPVKLTAHPANRGLSAARNTAIEAASGDILLYVDADAFTDPNLIEVLLGGFASGDPRLGGVGGRGIESSIHSLADRWRRVHASQGHGLRRRYVPYLFGLCMSFRVSALRRVGGFDPTYRTNAEDMDIGLRLGAAGYRLLYLPDARVFHQRNDDEASLKRAMAAWYGAAYRARRTNHAQPWTLFTGTLRRIVLDPLRDLLFMRDPRLAWLSVSMCYVKFRALLQSARSVETMR